MTVYHKFVLYNQREMGSFSCKAKWLHFVVHISLDETSHTFQESNTTIEQIVISSTI